MARRRDLTPWCRWSAWVVVALNLAACSGGGGAPGAASTDSSVAGGVTTTQVVGALGTTSSSASEPSTVVEQSVDVPQSTTSLPVAVPEAPMPNLAGFVVALDPGHNGANWTSPDVISRQVDIGTNEKDCDTTGTQTYGGYSESSFNLDLAIRLRNLLEDAGATVVMTRSTDDGVGPCIDERAAIGNAAEADVAISIHADGGPDGGRGFHVIIPTPIPGLTEDIAAESERLGLLVRDRYANATQLPFADYLGVDGLSYRGDLGGLNLSDVPKVFLEAGNMRNEVDAAMLSDAERRQVMAESLVSALADFLLSLPP